jgi:hypothetical protein
LLSHLIVWRRQEVLENRHGTTVNDNSRLLGGTRGNISQSPSSFKLFLEFRNLNITRRTYLNIRRIISLQKFNQTAQDSSFNDLLDWRVLL